MMGSLKATFAKKESAVRTQPLPVCGKIDGNVAQATGVPPIVREVLRSPGQLLNANTRAFMEPRFGQDFSRVRVHTDARAAESARSLNALAYTTKSDIVFGVGQYAPRTVAGDTLLAHELTHVVQQRQSMSAIQKKTTITSNKDALEREANHIADTVANSPIAPNDSFQKNVAPVCKSEKDAYAFETASAQMTLSKSRAIADTIVTSKSSSDLAYWFAELYYYITLFEIDDRGMLDHPSFVMHFIPIFYDMYALNAEHFSNQELNKIKKNWQEHFANASAIVSTSQLYPYVMSATQSLVSGVKAHIQGDMPEALAQAYRTYSATYCSVPPFQTYHSDFFEKNKPIFRKVRLALVNELINRGLGLAYFGRSIDPDFASKAADLLNMGLNIDEIYGWREAAWQAAKTKLGSSVHERHKLEN